MMTTLTYNNANQRTTEVYSGGTLAGLSVEQSYDSVFRPATISAKNGAATLASATSGYDTANRLSTITDGALTATYTHLANSPLVEKIDFRQSGTIRMTTTRQYDNINWLSAITSVTSSSARASHAYTYNNANQRTAATQETGAYWVYQYDSLGQVQNGKKYWKDGPLVPGQQFEYVHDTIGNRTSAKTGGTATGTNLRTATYTPNSLNQYSSRSVPGYVQLMGNAHGSATVKINGSTSGVYRRDEYFQNERTVSNGTNPQYPQYTIAAELNGGNNTRSGNVFVPKTPEVFTHDLDGNLTKDGRWSYTWDGENRLIEMEADTVSVPAAARRRLVFEYDWQGRRIRKQVYNWDAVALNYSTTAATDIKFLYDNWNLLMELYGSNNGYLRAYTWGQDLSGSMQGAGGVGGLLMVKPMSVNPMFVSYDGNGNVSGLFDSSNGNAMARYDYGPFGELFRLSGNQANQSPFRFSTKYTDDETDLVYYGYRFYNPNSGRWINRDPIEEEGGLNLYGFVNNCPISRIEFLGLGSWNVFETHIDPQTPGLSPRDEFADPNGFEVQYKRDPGECNGGRIILVQIKSSTGLAGIKAHVEATKADRIKHEKTKGGIDLPAMGPKGSTGLSYIDSPTGPTGVFGVLNHRMTAVAICIRPCRDDEILSTYYFEFDNKTRKITKRDGGYTDHFRAGIEEWKKSAGSRAP